MIPEHTVSQDTVSISGSRPVRSSQVKVIAPVQPHDHEFCEICLVMAGRGKHRTPNTSQSMRPGDVFITFPGQIHAIQPEPELTVWNVYYLAEWFLRDLEEFRNEPQVLALFFHHMLFGPQFGKDSVYLQIREMVRDEVNAELESISKECATAEPSAFYLYGCFAKSLHLLASASRQPEPLNFPTIHQDVWEVIARIEKMLKEGQVFDGEQLSQNSRVGPDRLARIFKQHTGLTPFAYFQQRRLQIARKRLLNPNHSITEVAMSLGFSDTSHFVRDFRKNYNTTPRRYRQTFHVI